MMTADYLADQPAAGGRTNAGTRVPPSDDLWAHLACPYCHSRLEHQAGGALCTDCQEPFPVTEGGILDLRLRRTKTVELTTEIGERYTYPDLPFETTAGSGDPPFDPDEVELARRLPVALAKHIPAAGSQDSLVLDLGCGTGIHRSVCESAGYRWVGLDVDSDEATVLGDAQALPFADNTFGGVLTTKVLGQVGNPFVAFSEIGRVLRPGGTLVGNVSSNEPFFGSNTFNMTPVGLHRGLRQAGLETERVFPGWDAFTAQAFMGRFPLMPRILRRAAVAPLRVASRVWYAVGSRVLSHAKTDEEYRRLNAAGELHFVAHAPPIARDRARTVAGRDTGDGEDG